MTMSIKAWSLALGCASAIAFGSIYTAPAADPSDSPKAWAHGAGFVLPRVVLSEALAIAAISFIAVSVTREGWIALRHPFIIFSVVLLLAAFYALVFIVRAIWHAS
jgi:hypothetical protein